MSLPLEKGEKKKYAAPLHDSSRYKFLHLLPPTPFPHNHHRRPHAHLFGTCSTSRPTRPHGSGARSGMTLTPPPPTRATRAARTSSTVPRGGSQTGPISAVLSYAASNPGHVIGGAPHLRSSPGRCSRTPSLLTLSSSRSRFLPIPILSLSLRLYPSRPASIRRSLFPALARSSSFVGYLVSRCLRSALSRAPDPPEASLVASTYLPTYRVSTNSRTCASPFPFSVECRIAQGAQDAVRSRVTGRANIVGAIIIAPLYFGRA